MEDSSHYFNIYYGGTRYLSFILQHPNGYYNILNNGIAWLASLCDVRLQPLLYHLFCLGMGIFLAVCLNFSGLIRTRALLLVSPLALGLSGMNHIYYYVSLTFQMYNVVVLLLCLLFLPFPRSKIGMICMALLATLLIWSGPYSVVALPACILLLLFERFRAKSIFYLWIILGVLCYTQSVEGGMIRFANILDPHLQQQILNVLFGQIFLYDLAGSATPLLIGLVLSGLLSLFFLLRRDLVFLRVGLVLLSIILLSLAPLFLSKKILLYREVFPCHIYIAQFFWTFFLLFALDALLRHYPRTQNIGVLVCIAAVITLVFFDNRAHPAKGFRTIMHQTSAFVHSVHEAEQLDLERHNHYVVMKYQSEIPLAPSPMVRVGSQKRNATRIPGKQLTLPSGNHFLLD